MGLFLYLKSHGELMKYDLKYPFLKDGMTISSVTIRRPKGRDMIAIGDDLSTLVKFYKEVESEGNDGGIAAPSSAVFASMVSIAAQLADLGDAAGDLDQDDLNEIITRALNSGEASGRGEVLTGDEQSRTHPQP